MANTPKIKSYEQYLGDIIRTYTSKIGVNDLNKGSVVLSFFETMAQALFGASGDVLSILRDFSLDRAKGDILKRIAIEERVIPISSKVATGTVTITDTNFTKISTKIFAGGTSVNVGSTKIKVSDASQFPATGSIYIGRGTTNVEGPLNYVSVTPVGTYYEITLDAGTPTTKFHNTSESVVLAQGGTRNISSGTILTTKGDNPVAFQTTKEVVILDGEDTVTDVPIAAKVAGSIGNVPSNSITEFTLSPFSGAKVTNPLPITNGRDTETEDELRDRVKRSRQSKGLGTAVAIKNSIQGLSSTEENSTITSSEVFSNSTETDLYIDNGEGYEEKTVGVGQEIIVDSALGGEQRFQLSPIGRQTAIAKAALLSTIEGPFNIKAGDTLSVLVGGVLSEHTFQSDDFITEGSVTGFEIASSINANPNLLFSARTFNNGKSLIIDAKEETNEYIQATTPTSTTGNDVAAILGLSTKETETLKLYKNNQPLKRNGRPATIQTTPQTNWASNIQTGDTLIISVDGTAPITYTFTDADFQAEGTHTTVNKTNSLSSWIAVMNAKMVGVTASINGDSIVLTSNLGSNSRAKLEIDQSSSLVLKGMFNLDNLVAQGSESDFQLSRNTLQFKLTKPLQKGDRLTAGTEDTQAQIKSNPIIGGIVTIPSEAHIWFLIDDKEATLINHGAASDTLMDITKQGSNIVRVRSYVDQAFSNVQVGDYFIIWSDEIDVNTRLEGRVLNVGSQVNNNDYFEFEITTAQYALINPQTAFVFKNGIVFLRSNKNPQKAIISAGTDNINNIATVLDNVLVNASVSIVNDENFIVKTNTMSTNGSVLVVTFNNGAKALGFTEGQSDVSKQTHYAFEETSNKDADFPLFITDSINSERYSDNPNNRITDFVSATDLSGVININDTINFRDRYLNNGQYKKVAQSSNEHVQIDNVSSNTISIDRNDFIRRLLNGERFYVSRGYDFAATDTITVILDSDASNKTFNVPLFRRAVTNTTLVSDPLKFNAYDFDAGATESFVTFFGSGFSFKNYKAFMKAKRVINPNTGTLNDAILFRSAVFGEAGEKISLGYIYPTVPNAPIADIKEGDQEAKIKISLKSGASRLTSIDSTTVFDVTINANFPTAGVDEVTFTHSGGTAPALTSVQVGDYVTITNDGEFSSANTGTFKVSSKTASSFTVRMKNGIAVAETGKSVLTSNTITFFQPVPTTAQEIVDYVNNNLSDFFTAELVDDGGLTGTGDITTSTEEDNNFAFDAFYLLDGMNYIASSDLSATSPNAQFVFKKPLQLPQYVIGSTVAYSFNNGEEIRLVPTTAKQIKEFMNVLAVSGISTVAKVNSANRESNLQFASKILGSAGAFRSTGGNGDSISTSVLGSAVTTKDNVNTKVEINKTSASGFNVGQIVKVKASSIQNKKSGFILSNNVSIVPNSPSVGKSTITFANKDVDGLFFGQPSNAVRLDSSAFHVERHGKLTFISWDGMTGTFNGFKNLPVDLGGSGNIGFSVNVNTVTGNLEISVTSGGLNFQNIMPQDTISIADLYTVGQTETFEVIGISEDKTTISVKNQGQPTITTTLPVTNFSATTSIRKGDVVEINAPFHNLNRGTFQIIEILDNGFYIENPNSVEERVIVAGTPRTVAHDATTSFDVIVGNGDTELRYNGTGTAVDFTFVKLGDMVTLGSSFNVANQGKFMITKVTPTSIFFAHASAVAETGVTNANLVIERDSFVFNQYENALVGDLFDISGDVLGADNAGTYTISEVLDRNNIVVDQILTAQSSVVLADKAPQVSVKEQFPYTSYRFVRNKYRSTVNADRYVMVLSGTEQVEKINELAGTTIEAIGKLGLSQKNIIGIDAYRYYTGLLAEAVRVVYGDSTDEVTYPGVAAAGAEIFIKPPQIRRIKVSVNIRVKTGIPFNRIADQARNNISALVNATKIGNSIAISDIVASLNGIPGVKSVAISSPQYDPSNDVITVSAFEKPFILDPNKDIIVDKIG